MDQGACDCEIERGIYVHGTFSWHDDANCVIADKGSIAAVPLRFRNINGRAYPLS